MEVVMKKILGILLFGMLFVRCSGSKDTSLMNAEENLAYAMELYNDEDYEFSIKEFQSIILQFPGNQVNDDAQYYLAMSYYNDGQYLLAAYEFSKLIRDIKGSEYVPMAQFMLADSYYQLSPHYSLDQTYTKKAISEFQSFIDFFPTDPKVEEAERKISEMNYKLAKKLYNSAEIYEKMGYFNAAIEYYTKVYERYHDTEFAPEAHYKKIQLLLDKERFAQAVENMKLFLNKYTNSKYTSEIQNLYDEMKF